MQIVVVLIVGVCIAVLPVMFAAKMVNAERATFGASLLAVILQAIFSAFLQRLEASHLVALAVDVVGGSIIFSVVLGTTILRGFVIGILVLVITVVVVFLLASSFSVFGGLSSSVSSQFSAAPAISAPAEPDESATSFRCDGRTRCSQMTSCEEATYFSRYCPNTQMDGDGDGVPCERQWCG